MAVGTASALMLRIGARTPLIGGLAKRLATSAIRII
jgi:hypothetical protein